jgi:hypothetical protein
MLYNEENICREVRSAQRKDSHPKRIRFERNPMAWTEYATRVTAANEKGNEIREPAASGTSRKPAYIPLLQNLDSIPS